MTEAYASKFYVTIKDVPDWFHFALLSKWPKMDSIKYPVFKEIFIDASLSNKAAMDK